MAGVFMRNTVLGKSGPGNWYGDGSDGDIRITSAGAEQSFDGGVTWSTISGWTLVGTVVSIPSTQDGDMVMVNAISLTVDAGYTLTVANRCRGLLVYVQGVAAINGEMSMTARGCKANPFDTTVTSQTPVLPSDGNAVDSAGPTIARLASGGSEAGVSNLNGCGSAVVASETNQPEVLAGFVLSIPPVGGTGGARLTVVTGSGNAGASATDGLGGGGSGAAYGASSGTIKSGAGADATCFSSGAGGGGNYNGYNSEAPGDAGAYGGKGGRSDDPTSGAATGGPGAGNPGGSTYSGAGGGEDAEDGTAGVMLLIARQVTGSGSVTSCGSLGGRGAKDRSDGLKSGGGSSGGGLAAILAASIAGTITVDASGGASVALGGAGGDGTAITQIIDA